MTTDPDRILRIQADKLAEAIGLPKQTKFEIAELKALSTSPINTELTFRGKKIITGAGVRALADLLLIKIEKLNKSQ